MKEGKKQYEIGFLLKNEEVYERLLKAIEEAGGEGIQKNQITKIRLAYPINKDTSGFFSFVIFDLEPEKISSLDRNLKMADYILRYLIITPPVAKEIRKERERRPSEPKSPPKRTEVYSKPSSEILSNELLEKKLEEILK